MIWQDLRRIAHGVVAFVQYLRSWEIIDIALGVFEAASFAVVVGRPCCYVIRIANVGEKVWDVTLAIEISPHSLTNVVAKPSARFAKRCSITASRTTEIEFHYDWCTTAVFMVDTVASPPDEFWKSEIKTLQRYVVSAILSDHTGKHLDRLQIYQELKG